MSKILLNGYKGRMGRAIAAAVEGSGNEIVFQSDMGDDPSAGIAMCETVVDFSFRDATLGIAKLCAAHGKALVIGTTGHTQQQRAEILEAASGIPVVWAGNYSLGVNLLNHLVGIAAKALDSSYDVEIVEMHHNKKKDSPSGTAEKLMEIVLKARSLSRGSLKFGREGLVGERPQNEVGVHSLRGGSVVGEHTVIFATNGERLELTHRAEDRDIFAKGALEAAKWVAAQPAGLYGMEDVLGIS